MNDVSEKAVKTSPWSVIAILIAVVALVVSLTGRSQELPSQSSTLDQILREPLRTQSAPLFPLEIRRHLWTSMEMLLSESDKAGPGRNSSCNIGPEAPVHRQCRRARWGLRHGSHVVDADDGHR